MSRPKSANDTHLLVGQDGQHIPEPLNSPTKGILMTPGTAAARKKNVTFGDHVVENQDKRSLKSGIPDDCPGKFPSPWNKTVEDVAKDDEATEKSRGRSKLTEALEQARDESRKRKMKDRHRSMDVDQETDTAAELAEPRSESGKYWKHEYDIYRANTQREVKKLITKQKAAKSFAHAKDMQCTELADQLRQEQKKVRSLEAKTTEFSTLIKELQQQLQASREAENMHQEEAAALKRQLGRKDSARPGSSDNGPPAAPSEQREPAQRDSGNLDAKQRASDELQRPSEPYQPLAQLQSRKTDPSTLRGRVKPKPDNIETKQTDGIWAQSFRSSSPIVARSGGRPPPSPMGGRAVTSGTESTPLKSLSINTLRDGRQKERSASMEVECKSVPDLDRKDSGAFAKRQESRREDSPLQSPTTPKPAVAAQTIASSVVAQQTSPHRKPTEGKPKEDLSMSVPLSSPFQPEATASPPRIGLTGPRTAQESKTSVPNNTKENVSPIRESNTLQSDLKSKPSAMWTSINAPQPQVARRTTSVTGKDVKDVPVDRLEAARARIASRRMVS